MASVYEQNDVVKLWNDIMNVHWKFLDAEETMEKIELRRQLEDLIVQFLCNVPHDRKFFLPPTEQVLKSSIASLEDFSAYKASIGFEAISQYANNLFTKPWRKEYKIIKMYSGFYQHEIAANLIGAQVLFEQMGYRMLPNQTLVLDGPICPDRVTNVSKDAITANVECQIMKDIYRELTEMTLAVDWSDIYSFRECNTMDVRQSVQQMAELIKEKHHKNQQARRKAYDNQLAPADSSCNSCKPYQFHPHMQQQQSVPPLPPLTAHQQQQPLIPFCGPQPMYNTAPCNIHNQHLGLTYGYHNHNSYQSYLPAPPPSHAHPSSQSSMIPPHPPSPLAAIPHSKSLDHYMDPATAMYNLTACMQRHSIDQAFDYAAVASASHYGGPMGMAPPTGAYDVVDGYNLAYNNHPYNVSGNRFPLPYNLSTNVGPCMNGTSGKQSVNDPYYHQPSINGYQHIPPYYLHRSTSNGPLYGPQGPMHRHANDIYMNHHFDHAGAHTNPSIPDKKKTSYDEYDVPSTRHGGETKHTNNDLVYKDAREEAKKERKKPERSVRNTELLVDYECDMLPESLVERQQQLNRYHYLQHQTSRNSRQSDFDSYEDEQLQAGAYQRANNVNKRISSKNQDGIGSYESWNYVFQNLEKQGYNKDLGERGNFLVDNEEEEYPAGDNSRGSTIKRNSNDKLKAMRAKSADKVDGIHTPTVRQGLSNGTRKDRDFDRNEAIARVGQKPTLVQKVTKPSSNNQTDNSQKANHATYPASSGSVTIKDGSSSRRNSLTRKNPSSTKENDSSNNNANGSNTTGGGILVNHNGSNHLTSSSSGKKKTASFDTAAATIINPQDDYDTKRCTSNGESNVSEWNCEFCTFLNPDTERICEMCAKSRDFNLKCGAATSASNGTATCV
ncbi:protein tamozhennic isoform X2 [Toxorhynchites rutilus septentrionalis]|uniref:protein tamozhennic isoform X2 n=1 Tax=Toxorhynchites rutilus septentrionalis TaxID=329112 RepID=UPI00247920A2|nr:protein tamozhennic isoform X2 [Toxorhynchites rutilus septentrionalis]